MQLRGISEHEVTVDLVGRVRSRLEEADVKPYKERRTTWRSVHGHRILDLRHLPFEGSTPTGTLQMRLLALSISSVHGSTTLIPGSNAEE